MATSTLPEVVSPAQVRRARNLSWRFPRTRPVLEGMPVVIVHDGVLNEELMRYERLPDTELFEAMREQGIEDVSSVRVGILEPDGKLSFFTEQEHQPAPEKPQG